MAPLHNTNGLGETVITGRGVIITVTLSPTVCEHDGVSVVTTLIKVNVVIAPEIGGVAHSY